MKPLRFRQVHLDFHTSEHIPGVGAGFNPKQWQEALKRGHVDSITIFSKCHHGMSYHQTRVGQMHPHLDFELMARQIEACRAIDVKCPIYISAGWDEWAAFHHPEWIAVSRDGKMLDPRRPGWKNMAFDTPYLDYLCEQIVEVVENYDAADGIFLDIIFPRDNFSPLGLINMRDNGVDILDDEAVARWNVEVVRNYFAKATAACKVGDENRGVFHNSGHIPKGVPEALKWNSHLELESLPTGGWGYDHFPISAKYAATTGFDFLGMTGKFHTTWGEFGGFKRPNALRYECAAMLAFGSKCSIGDQLHPSGEMNFDTYDLIGAAYAEVEAKQAWCEGARPVSDIALVSPEAAREAFQPHGGDAKAEQGAARMLLELGMQFDVVDLRADLGRYRVVILPDEITLQGEFLQQIQTFLESGGKLLLSGESGFNPAKTGFAFDANIEVVGKSAFDPDYLVPGDKAPTPLVRGPFVVAGGAWNVRVGGDFETLATRRDTYFNRTWEHFCSHQHTPDSGDSQFPGAVSNGRIAYFAHPIFTCYRASGQPLLRDLVFDALKTLLPEPSVETNLPTAARTSLMRQEEHNRTLLHLLFAVPQKRGDDIEVIEDLFSLRDVQCLVRTGAEVQSVQLVPSGQALEFSVKNGAVRFVVPEVLCHAMIVLQH